jgi:xanthine dehydrogenase/oxidase
VLVSVHIPWTRQHEFVQAFKQSHRREDDIALVNACMRMLCKQTDGGVWQVENAAVSFGGVAPTVVACKHTATFLEGKRLDKGLLQV